MTWLFIPVLMLLPALYLTWDLHRIRMDCQRMRADIQAKETEAAYLYEKAREVYADANARWSYVVRIEGRVH